MREPLAALILAAGHSSRMGTLKPLLRFGALTALEQAVRRIQEGGVSDIRVVIGHGGATLRAALPDLPVRWITNPDPDRGMLSSVLAGVATLRAERDAFLLLPADIPLVSPATIAALLAEWRCHQPPPPVLYPLYRGKRGHPPLIATYCVPVTVPADTPGGLRTILRAWDSQARELAVADPAILQDCDTPADYARLLELGGFGLA